MNATEIIKALPLLSPPERERVRQALTALTSMGGGVPTKATPIKETHADTILVMQALIHAVRGLGIEYVSFENLRKSSQFDSFNRKVPDLLRFLHKGGLRKDVEVKAMLDIAFRELHKQLRSSGYPTGARTMMAQVHRLTGIIDALLPGYASSGQLGLITRRVMNAGR